MTICSSANLYLGTEKKSTEILTKKSEKLTLNHNS